MPAATFELKLRPATLDDAAGMADLDTKLDPSEPRDPVLLRHIWLMEQETQKCVRQVAWGNGGVVAFSGAAHELWGQDEKRFGVVRARLDHDLWADSVFEELLRMSEAWLLSEGAKTAVARVREDFTRELTVLEHMGYREDRRMRTSELDLVAQRDHILTNVAECRRQMTGRGVDIHPLSDDSDPDRYQKLFRMMTESERDIPTTVPWRELNFDEWKREWFDNPAITEGRLWIARVGEEVVGMTVLDYPVVRGIPWTAYTGTLRSVRGRGIARALKYESMAQAIEAGFERVRTNNDADNPPILRINAEMGYHLISPVLELHRPL